jgi:hypothetical protein
VRNTGKIFELINNIKKIPKKINSYIPIYPDIDIEVENIKFPETYKMPAEYTDREIMTGIKNSARP